MMVNHTGKFVVLSGAILGLTMACTNQVVELPTDQTEPNQASSSIATGVNTAPAQESDPVLVPPYFNARNDNVAIEGFDPVAYFTLGVPKVGRTQFTMEWGGVTWRFENEDHLALFTENPEKYAPKYGGFCAWAVSQGYTAPVDPNAWKIIDDKLYLNFDFNVQKRWESNENKYITQANQNWRDIVLANMN